MANEMVHATVGTSLTQIEFEAVGLHVLNSQATGDLIYASSASQLSRIGIGAANTVLHVVGTTPTWSATLAGLTLTAPVISSISNTGTLTLPTTTGTLALTSGLPNRNAIINGNFDIWQRGTSFDNPNGVYTADRWKIDDAVDINVKLLRSTTVPDVTSTYSLRVEVMTATGGAGSYSDITQKIEDYVFFRGKVVTLSCYVKCDAGVSGLIFIVDSVGNTGTAISATTWTKYTVQRTIEGAATSLYPQLRITRDGQVVGKGINFAQVQLEVSSVNTPFEFRPYGTELALCQRYYKGDCSFDVRFPAQANSTSYSFPYTFTTMRTDPTLTFTAAASASANVTGTPTITIPVAGKSVCRMALVATTAGADTYYVRNFELAAEL